jgi:hypothetical protein
MSRNNFFGNEGEDITPQVIADGLQQTIDEEGESGIQGVIVIVKLEDGYFEVGYTTGKPDEHLGRIEIAKKILMDEFIVGEPNE